MSDKERTSSSFYESEEFLSCLLLCAEAAKHARRDRRRARLLHATHSHTQMPVQIRTLSKMTSQNEVQPEDVRSLHDDRDAAGLDRLLDGDRDLLRETFLYLQATTKCLRYPGKLGDP